MPLKDLLWACPHCHAIEALDRDGRCRACGTHWRRGRGARVRAEREGAAPEERDAPAWLGALPWPDLDGEGFEAPPGPPPPWSQDVIARLQQRETALRSGAGYLGRIEVFGPKQRGRLTLDAERLRFTAQSGAGIDWPLAELTAIQPASSAIQLKARGRPVLSLRFPEGSVRLWEQRLKYCTRNVLQACGRGRVREFQPCIRCA